MAMSPRRVFRLAGSARYLVVSELHEIVLQSFQCTALLVEVVPQVVRLFEYVLAMVDHALADERRHLESSQSGSPGKALGRRADHVMNDQGVGIRRVFEPPKSPWPERICRLVPAEGLSNPTAP